MLEKHGCKCVEYMIKQDAHAVDKGRLGTDLNKELYKMAETIRTMKSRL